MHSNFQDEAGLYNVVRKEIWCKPCSEFAIGEICNGKEKEGSFLTSGMLIVWSNVRLITEVAWAQFEDMYMSWWNRSHRGQTNAWYTEQWLEYVIKTSCLEPRSTQRRGQSWSAKYRCEKIKRIHWRFLEARHASFNSFIHLLTNFRHPKFFIFVKKDISFRRLNFIKWRNIAVYA